MSILHNHGINNVLFVNATKIHQVNAKDSEIKPYPSCLGNTSKKHSFVTMKKRMKWLCTIC